MRHEHEKEQQIQDGGTRLTAGDTTSVSVPASTASHADLVEIAAKWLKRQGCNVVLTERFAGNDNRGECPDAIGWYCSDFSSIVIECKVSTADFIADAAKPWRTGPAMGHERYFLAPKGLLLPMVFPPCWGLLEWDGRVVRRVFPSLPFVDRAIEHEARLLLAELRIFHARGITYPKLGNAPVMTAKHEGEQ